MRYVFGLVALVTIVNFVGGWMSTGNLFTGLVQGLVTIPLFLFMAWVVGWIE